MSAKPTNTPDEQSNELTVSGVLREAALLAYENVVPVIITSSLWGILLLPGLVVLTPFWGGLYAALIAPSGFALVGRFLYLSMRRKRRRYEEFRSCLRQLLGRSLPLGLLGALMYVIIYASWWRYVWDRQAFNFYLAVFQSCMLGMFFIGLTYVVPLLVQTDLSTREALLTSFRFFLLRPGYTFVLWVQLVSAALVLLVTTVGFIILFGGLAAVFLNVATENLIERFAPLSAKG